MSDSDTGDVQCLFECDGITVEWTVLEAKLEEAINAPYRSTIKLRSEDPNAEPTELLGKSCKLTMKRNDLSTDYTGIVHEVEDDAERREEGGASVAWMDITIRMSAALAMFSQNRQTRIFQDKTVPEILEEVLKSPLEDQMREYEADFDYRDKPFPKCEYRVQYDESDLDFCHRLMEEEGILYWFVRELGPEDPLGGVAEKLVVTDNPTAVKSVSSTDGSQVQFAIGTGTRESIEAFCRTSSLRPTKLTTRHFDWTHPSRAVTQELETPKKRYDADGAQIKPVRENYQHDSASLTFDDYDDKKGYQAEDSLPQSQVRRELDQRDAVVIRGRGTAIGFSAGYGFELLKHPLEGEYLITTVKHSFSVEGSSKGYHNTFRCVPEHTLYHPNHRTPKPSAVLETATVVGPKDQEIHTDNHGRVKVQFHWDREGENDEHSSCFIRVAQPWAGEGFGFVFLPRIGMEVTVSFLHGDPDRPVITGAVYNGDNPPPYTLPDDMTRSTIRTKSSKDAPEGHYNELSFEDAKGKEEVYLRAQRNLREQVLANHAINVGSDHKLEVKKKQSIEVGEHRKVKAKSQEVEITEHSNHKTKTYKREVTGKEERIVGELVETVKTGSITRKVEVGGVTETIKGPVACTVESGGATRTVTGGQTETIKTGNSAHNVSVGNYSVDIKGPIEISSKQRIILKAPEIKINEDTTFWERNFKNEFYIEKGEVVLTKTSNGVLKSDVWAGKNDDYGKKTEIIKTIYKYVRGIEKGETEVSKLKTKVAEQDAKMHKVKAKLQEAHAALLSIGND